MANSGFALHLDTGRHFETLESLKKWIAATGKWKDMEERIVCHSQLTTGTAAELESTDAIAITQIGKTELTLLLAGDADNASTSGKTYTLVYVDNEGESHTAVGTGTATLNGTPVAFVPAVTDFYAAVSFTASGADANVNVYAATAAIAAVYATIATTATSATQANLLGVGAVYGRGHTNHADSAGEVQYLHYSTPWGELKFGHCTHGANGEDEIRFFEATDDGDGTLTATTTTVKDFYRIIRYWVPVAPTANSHEFFLTDAACGNVDGSSSDIYGVVKEGETESINTRLYARPGYRSWLPKVCITQGVNAAADYYIMQIYFTPLNDCERNVALYFGASFTTYDRPIELEPGTDVYFTVVDGATAETFTVGIEYVEVEQ